MADSAPSEPATRREKLQDMVKQCTSAHAQDTAKQSVATDLPVSDSEPQNNSGISENRTGQVPMQISATPNMGLPPTCTPSVHAAFAMPANNIFPNGNIAVMQHQLMQAHVYIAQQQQAQQHTQQQMSAIQASLCDIKAGLKNKRHQEEQSDDHPSKKRCSAGDKYSDISDGDMSSDGDSDSDEDVLPLPDKTGAFTSDDVPKKSKMLQSMKKKFEKSEEYSPAVHTDVADLVNTALKNNVNSNDAKELQAKYVRPGNCDTVIVPDINPELWENKSISRYHRTQDCRLQKIQGLITSAIVPITQLVNAAVTDDKLDDTGFEHAVDALSLLTYAHNGCSMFRRQKLERSLDEKYKGLCNSTAPVTNHLFGDDLNKKVTEMQTMQKLAKEVSMKQKTGKMFTGKRRHEVSRYGKGKYSSNNQTRDRQQADFLYDGPSSRNKWKPKGRGRGGKSQNRDRRE
ncbi:MAG: hypothetical protein ABW185_16610 [Sedimenticola sp.]